MRDALPAALIASMLVAALVIGPTDAGDPLTSSAAWRIAMPLALAGTVGIAAWGRRAASPRLAWWTELIAIVAALYWLGAAVAGAMERASATASVWFTLALSVPYAGWVIVLAALQCAAIIAGQEAGCLSIRRAPIAVIQGVTGVVYASGVVGAPPDLVPVPLLPAEVAINPVFEAVSAVLINGWMLSLMILPVSMFVMAARATGAKRRARVRIAVGSLLPALVVLVCGMMGALVFGTEGERATQSHTMLLALGFCLALPLTTGWLAATVREARAATGGWFTSLATVLRVTLWTLYVLGLVQVVTLVTPALGENAAAGAIATALVAAATLWPWVLLVRFVLRRFDVRTAVAHAALAALPPGSEPAGQVCARVVAEAFGDAHTRVLLARPDGRWIDADGLDVAPRADTPKLDVTDATGRVLGIVEHNSRFTDLRPLALALRPLFERASWEAELREQAARVAAERARADAAASDARRRIERDLHDGVQGRLVSLGLGLSIAHDQLPDALARDLVAGAVRELQESVAELRELASGRLSHRLDGRGLASAVTDLVARVPLTVTVDIPEATIPAIAESTAYFVIAEALTNAVKHSGAERVVVRVEAGDSLSVEVWDDGCGGADARVGTGLRGLRERVRAVGGHLVVSERMPHGTRVEAVLPCGS